MNDGYIYVLTNPSFAEYVKIGKTTRNPEERAAELSRATGVPHPFVVSHARHVSDVDKAEIIIQQFIPEVRVTPNREFFRLSAVEAASIVDKVAVLFGEPAVSDRTDLTWDPANNPISEPLSYYEERKLEGYSDEEAHQYAQERLEEGLREAALRTERRNAREAKRIEAGFVGTQLILTPCPKCMHVTKITLRRGQDQILCEKCGGVFTIALNW